MDYRKLFEERNTVREYLDEPLSLEHEQLLEAYLQQINQENGLHFQLALNASQVFENHVKPKGRFENARNFITLVSADLPNRNEDIGYYGEKVVLYAQHLGLNTCWIASTYTDDPTTYTLEDGESLSMIISVGQGQHQGKAHNSKPIEETYEANQEVPEWFMNGVRAALRAPTARNQQSYRFILVDEGVKAVDLGGNRSDVDLGIVKLHFELGAQKTINWV